MNTPLVKWAILFMIIVLAQHFVFTHVAYDAVKIFDIKQILSALDFTQTKDRGTHEIIEGEISIPLTKKRGAWLVEIEFNDLYEATLIVDTGASITALSEDLAFDIGLTPDPRYDPASFKTANGNTHAWLTHIQTVRVGEASMKNLRVAIIDFSNHSADSISGLLGLNFLDQFDWRLDQEHETLLLQSKS